MGLRDFTPFDVVERNARLYPDLLAFAFDRERITHAGYLARVQRLAAGLARAGVRPGDRIAVLSQNNLEFVDLYGAAARLGAIVVPINWRLSAEEIAYVAADAAPKIVIADVANQPVLQGAQQKLSTVEHWYGIGGGAAPFAPYAELLKAGAEAGHSATPHFNADAGLVMIHTAAVGGRLRGALLSHANLIASSVQLLHYWSLTPDDVNLGVLPLFHVAGLGMLASQANMPVAHRSSCRNRRRRRVGSSYSQRAGDDARRIPADPDDAARRHRRDRPADLASLRIATGPRQPGDNNALRNACARQGTLLGRCSVGRKHRASSRWADPAISRARGG